MDIKFDAADAEQLIRQMSTYCQEIVDETRALLSVTDNSSAWNDNQSVAFKNNMTELAKDLDKALSLESEYMRTFHQRVTELRG